MEKDKKLTIMTRVWLSLLATLLFTGCAENDSSHINSAGEAVGRLTTNIVPFIGDDGLPETAKTRAAESSGTEAWLRRTQMLSGDMFLLNFPDGHGGYTPTSDGAGLNYYPTCDGSGGVYISDGSNTISGSFYLISGQAEGTMRGYYPASWNWGATFTVAKGQNGSAEYSASDLMFGTGALVRKAGADLADGKIDFRHAMAKVRVTLTAGSNVTHLFYVRIVSGYAKGTLKETDRNKQQLVFAGDGSHEAFDKSKYGEEITHGSPLSLYEATSGSADPFTGGTTLRVSGLLPPQELAVSDAFLEVKVRVLVDKYHGGSGTTKDVVTRYRFATKQVIEGGHCYTLSVEPAVDEGTAEVTVNGFDSNATSAFGNSISVSAPDTYYLSENVSMKMVPVLREGYSNGAVTVAGDEESYTTLRNTAVTGTLGPYYIGQMEVTEAVWEAVMGASGSLPTTSQLPKTNVSWNQICGAGGFLDKLNSITEDQRPGGFRFELPTEAQWEFAAHGGVHGGNSYVWGGSATSPADVAWYQSNSSGSKHIVGSKNPSNLGLYDMSGNVEEILADHYVSSPETTRGKDYIQLPNPASATGYVMAAGGSYSSSADGVKVAVRSNFPQNSAVANRGFRVVLRKVQVGDVYYSNGACGTYWEHPTGTGRTPVGIVFNDKTTDYDKFRGFKSGHVMALKEVSDNANNIVWTAWSDDMNVKTASGIQNLKNIQVTDQLFPGTNTNDNFIVVMGDLDGLKHCEQARANAEKATTWTIENLPAINAAFNYNALPTPVTSSGWYLPSIGQCYHWWVTMGKETFEYYDQYFPADVNAGNWNKMTYNPGQAVFFISNGWNDATLSGRNVSGKMIKAINDFVKGKLGTAANIAYFTPLEGPNDDGSSVSIWDYTYKSDGSKNMVEEVMFWTSTEATVGSPWFLRFRIAGTDRDIDIWSNRVKTTSMKMRPVLSF